MTNEEKLMAGVKFGAVMVIGSLLVSKVCKKGIEYYRERAEQKEQELIFEEESI